MPQNTTEAIEMKKLIRNKIVMGITVALVVLAVTAGSGKAHDPYGEGLPRHGPARLLWPCHIQGLKPTIWAYPMWVGRWPGFDDYLPIGDGAGPWFRYGPRLVYFQ